MYKRQDLQIGYITNAEPGCGLLKIGSALIPFVDKFPKHTKLYLSLIHIYLGGAPGKIQPVQRGGSDRYGRVGFAVPR